MSNNHSSGRTPIPFDPSLLQPIVRSKRTPMACTECRRRQVKCSGTMPRCERCLKKNIECTYMSLSDQRSGGGSISRTGTPSQAAHGQPQAHHGSRSAASAGWQAGGTYPANTAYAAPQGWQADTSSGQSMGQYGTQGVQPTNQNFSGVPMPFQQGFAQQAAYAQGANTSQSGGGMYSQGYGAESFPAGTSYSGYAQAVPPSTDPRYAYPAAQMAGMSGGQNSAGYVGQYTQQMYFDPNTGQMIPADLAASQWTDTANAGFQSFPGQN